MPINLRKADVLGYGLGLVETSPISIIEREDDVYVGYFKYSLETVL